MPRRTIKRGKRTTRKMGGRKGKKGSRKMNKSHRKMRGGAIPTTSWDNGFTALRKKFGLAIYGITWLPGNDAFVLDFSDMGRGVKAIASGRVIEKVKGLFTEKIFPNGEIPENLKGIFNDLNDSSKVVFIGDTQNTDNLLKCVIVNTATPETPEKSIIVDLNENTKLGKFKALKDEYQNMSISALANGLSNFEEFNTNTESQKKKDAITIFNIADKAVPVTDGTGTGTDGTGTGTDGTNP